MSKSGPKKQLVHRWSFVANVTQANTSECKTYPVPGVFLGYKDDTINIVKDIQDTLTKANSNTNKIVVVAIAHEVVSEQLVTSFASLEKQLTVVSQVALVLAERFRIGTKSTQTVDEIIADLVKQLEAYAKLGESESAEEAPIVQPEVKAPRSSVSLEDLREESR